MKFTALTFVAPALAGSVSPVQKVVQLLGELGTKVENDLSAESKAMGEYSEYCDDEITEKGFAIKTASDDIERFEAVVEEADGDIQKFDAEISSDSATANAKANELAEAKALRKKENGDFVAAEKELVDTVDMLARASSVLKRELSFVQSGSKSKSEVVKGMGALVQGLGAIVNAAWVDPKEAKNVKAFLEADDELSLKQPQASVSNYDSKSGGIVETLNDMRDHAQDSLRKLRRDETKSTHAFQLLQQSLQDAIKNLNDSIAVAKQTRSATQESKAKAEEDLAKTKDVKAADEAYKKKMETSCASKARSWAQRQKTAAEELKAISQAKQILTSGVKVSLLQEKASVAVHDEKREELAGMIRSLGRKYNSFQLVQLANHAQSDPFVKVRGLIEDMVQNLEKQAQSEATHESFCVSETTKSAKKRAAKEAQVDKYTTRLDKANAAVAQLKIEISDLQSELQEIAKANAEATAIRQKENADYKQSSKDQKESIEAVAKAIEVLNNFYGSGAALVQQPELGSSKTDSASNIVSFLEVAQSDFSNMLVQTETAENEAKAAYETLMQENAVSQAAKETSVKGKNSEIKSLKVAIENNNSDLNTENTELNAVIEYIEKLKPQCENKAMSYEERKARRDDEIAGLRHALEILEGEDIALVQSKSKAFLQRN